MAILDSHTFAAETPEPSERQTTPLPQENATQGETAALTVQIPRDKVNTENLMKLLQGFPIFFISHGFSVPQYTSLP